MAQGLRTLQQALTIQVHIAKLTSVSAAKVDRLIFRYGALAPEDMERTILLANIRAILSEWSDHILSLGGEPGDLWAVTIPYDGGELTWQYPCSQMMSGRSR